jgi:serine/threonine protein kinase
MPATPQVRRPPPPLPYSHPPSSPPPPISVAPKSGGTIAQSQRSLIGQLIDGKYLVRGVLGEGGMGTVFEAENRALRRSVAVKVLHPAQARKKVAVKRFHQEARAAGAIGHPNICEVYDLGTLEDGSPYLVMECLQGETLAERISAEGGLGFEDVLDVVSQVLSGLVAAHDKGIVHRDIKPENIFLTRRAGIPPVAKLLDFGVSKMMPGWAGTLPGEEEQMNLTRTGMVMGTPYYMSPEQARGDRNLDARVDLWACGVILYEALTGRRPFIAANYNALLLQILTTSPRPARELRPALPAAFDQVMIRSLARAREDRYQSAEEFQAALKPLRRGHIKTGSVTVVASTPIPPPNPLSMPTPYIPMMPRVPGQSNHPGHAQQARRGSSPPPGMQTGQPMHRSQQVQARRIDPLASLPSLGAPPSSRIPNESGTNLALDSDHLDSGATEMLPRDQVRQHGHDDGRDVEIDIDMDDRDAPAPHSGSGFDERPTEIHRPEAQVPPSADWDDVTTRLDPKYRPSFAQFAQNRARKPEPRPASNLEDTVKIEGDLEAHFADEIARSKS